jgi:hypothetical protein
MPSTLRRLAWIKEQRYGLEFADVRLSRQRLAATGVAIGAEPLPYRLDYRLETRRGFLTARLRVTTRGEGWQRALDLRRSPAGSWSVEAQAAGEAPLSPPGGAGAALSGALDCDLGLSPLTNSMPVLRHRLLEGGGALDFEMAWVSVPDLAVQAAGQRYTFLRRERERTVIRYENADGSFQSDLVFDADGLVLDYPQLARRLT